MQLQSAVYRGRIWHHRLHPRAHKFSYRVFMVYLDLAELDRVLKVSPLWSGRRFSPARFRRSDYFTFPKFDSAAALDDGKSADAARATKLQQETGQQETEQQSIDESVRAAVEQQLRYRPTGAIRVLTNLRYFGYLINPISCYYCFDKTDTTLDALLIEVTNTPWGQRTHYVLDLRHYEAGQSLDFAKDMHVSPFMPMNMTYRWAGAVPGKQLRYTLASFMDSTATTNPVNPANQNPSGATPMLPTGRDSKEDGGEASVGQVRYFDSGVVFERVEINSRTLNRLLWQYPWMTGKVALAIYWQALKLWLKRIPFVAHPKRTADREQ